jgi:hypothetical protein
MKKKQSLAGNALIFGALTGITLILLSSFLAMSNNMDSGIRYLGYLLLAAGIVVGTLNYRDKSRDGYLGYGGCMGTGVLISVFAGVLAGIYIFVYMKYINTGLVDQMMEKVHAEWEKKGMTSEQMEVAETWTRRFMNPPIMTVFTVIGYAFVGSLLSLISSAFIQKYRPPFEGDILDQNRPQ